MKNAQPALKCIVLQRLELKVLEIFAPPRIYRLKPPRTQSCARRISSKTSSPHNHIYFVYINDVIEWIVNELDFECGFNISTFAYMCIELCAHDNRKHISRLCRKFKWILAKTLTHTYKYYQIKFACIWRWLNLKLVATKWFKFGFVLTSSFNTLTDQNLLCE